MLQGAEKINTELPWVEEVVAGGEELPEPVVVPVTPVADDLKLVHHCAQSWAWIVSFYDEIFD